MRSAWWAVVDQRIKICMLDAQLNQLSLGGVEIRGHRKNGNKGW